MADSLNAKLETGPYSYAYALIYYTGIYAEITKALKFSRNFGTGEYFAGMLSDRIARSEHLADVDLVTDVPLHWTRKLSRGYNQSEILARNIASALGVEYAELLKRNRRTSRQARIGGEMQAELRSGNVRGAFALRKQAGKMMTGRNHILVIDDVFTSGATLAECVKTIQATNAAVRISVATIAYAKG